jgi:transcriptional regulator with XRE-family HTH domain
MARTAHKQQQPRTKLARWRLNRGATQMDMVRDTGIPLSTYQRLEAGDYQRPPLQALVNCSKVLEVELADLLEDTFLRWHVFNHSAPKAPKVPSWKRHR